MRSSFFMTAIVVAGLSTSPLFAQEKPKTTEVDKNAEQKAKELIKKYEALDVKAKIGPEGTKIVDQLKTMSGSLSRTTGDAVARLMTSHNLRMIALAVQGNADKNKKKMPPEPGFDWTPLMPFIPQQAMPQTKWEYNVLSEVDIRKLGKGEVKAGLNQLGADSWELVSIREAQFYFKRPNVKLTWQLQIPEIDFDVPYTVPRKDESTVPGKTKTGEKPGPISPDDVPGSPDLDPTKPDVKKIKKTAAITLPEVLPERSVIAHQPVATSVSLVCSSRHGLP